MEEDRSSKRKILCKDSSKEEEMMRAGPFNSAEKRVRQNLKKLAYKCCNLYIWVSGAADYESEVRFSKLKMVDSI